MSTQSVIVPTARFGAFSRAAVEQRPQFTLADAVNWNLGFGPNVGYTVSRIGPFSRAAVEQHPRFFLADPSNWYTGVRPSDGFTVAKIGAFSRAAVERPPQLVLTNPTSWFSALTPAEGFTLPIFPPVDFSRPSEALPSPTITLKTADILVSPTTETPLTEEIPLSTEAPLISSDIEEISSTVAPTVAVELVTPELRLPVTTRAPGVPHHFKDDNDDNFIRYEVSDGVHKFITNRQSFEFRYTNRNTPPLLKSGDVLADIQEDIHPKAEVLTDETRLATPVDVPVATPVQETVTHITPPLIHTSGSESIQPVTVPSKLVLPQNVLVLPQIPPQIFSAQALISPVQTLPFDGIYARIFVPVA